MVAAMSQSEDAQLEAMGEFLVSMKLHASLQVHDWTTFARGYNGPSYAINQYDVRLKAEYEKYSSGPLPDLNVRAAQLYLTYLRFNSGPVDGIAGQHTLSALTEFRTRAGLAGTNAIDADTVAQLKAALASGSGPGRAGLSRT